MEKKDKPSVFLCILLGITVICWSVPVIFDILDHDTGTLFIMHLICLVLNAVNFILNVIRLRK